MIGIGSVFKHWASFLVSFGTFVALYALRPMYIYTLYKTYSSIHSWDRI